MHELTYVLEAETTLPMGIAGWGTLALGLLVAFLWLAYLYR